MKRWPVWVFVLVAVVLTLPSLWSGLWFDDLGQQEYIRQSLAGEHQQGWWDLFVLTQVDARKIYGGVVPWWSVPDLRVAFFRPIAAATHYLDHLLWPGSPELMHAQSIACFALLVYWVDRTYRRVGLGPRIANWSSLIFAGSYVHASAVTWVANRNALLAALFGVLALYLHVRWRTTPRSRLDGLWPSLCMLASLLSAEAGVASFAFLAAYAVTRPGGTRVREMLALLPPLAAIIGWRSLYSLAGYGASGSGAYVDPVREPLVFLQNLPERWGWLCAMQIVPLRALFVEGANAWSNWALVVIGVAAIGLVAIAVIRIWGRAPELRLWVVAFPISVLPFAASVANERLLTPGCFAASPILAATLIHLWGGDILRLRRSVQRILAIAVGLLHLVVSPMLLFWATFNTGFRFEAPKALGLNLGREEHLRAQSLVIVNTPSVFMVNAMTAARAAAGLSKPSFVWVLGATPGEVEVTTRGCCTVELAAVDGYIREPWSAYFRGPSDPLERGDHVETLAFTAKVLEVADGYPTRVRFRFEVPLDHASLRFVSWDGEDFVPYALPGEGGSVGSRG